MSRLAVALECVGLALVLALAGCQAESGPVEIKYGRDVCEMCGMIISSPRFATELRVTGDSKVHKFDDIGDALNWLSSSCKSLADIKELWVMNSTDGKTWLDAQKAYYRRGDSPMNYNFAAVAAQEPDTIPFEVMRGRVAQPQYVCKTGNKSDSGADQQPQGY
jgi:nitrous oxide reductase accessory protein NosL